MRLAVIPARGGSKRIPRKNLRSFHGKPMIAWSIMAAFESECFDRVIISTDDEDIASVAINYGAEVPFMRPPELADDHTATVPVIAHAMEVLRLAGYEAKTVCCIYATAPFVAPRFIKLGLDALNDYRFDYAFSTTTYAHPIQRAMRRHSNGTMELLNPEHSGTRTQDLEEIFHDAGQFYWGRSEAWRQMKPILSEKSTGIVLPRYLVQDIDTLEDWKRAELMFSAVRSFDL